MEEIKTEYVAYVNNQYGKILNLLDWYEHSTGEALTDDEDIAISSIAIVDLGISFTGLVEGAG